MRTEEFSKGPAPSCWDDIDPPSLANVQPVADTAYGGLRGFGTRMAQLVRTVEAEIVPRLVLARRSPVRRLPASVATLRPMDTPYVVELSRLLLAHDVVVANAYVDTIRQQGMQPQNICLNLLAPAARRLGELWEQDECDFVQVTRALCSLHQVLHQLSADWRPSSGTEAARPARRALLASAAGEQHTFGIVMVGQFFRLGGWEIYNEFPTTNEVLLEVVNRTWFAIVGLSLGSEVRLETVKIAIKAIRCTSRNPGIGIMVGGPLFVRQPQLAAAVGADATASDGREAVRLADALFATMDEPG